LMGTDIHGLPDVVSVVGIRQQLDAARAAMKTLRVEDVQLRLELLGQLDHLLGKLAGTSFGLGENMSPPNSPAQPVYLRRRTTPSD
jgi:hypothetical protein